MNRILVIEGATAAGATTAAVGGALLWALRSKRKKVLVVSLELKHPVIPSELNNLWNELPNTLRFQHYSRGVPEPLYRTADRDLGLYYTTKRDEDKGKFRTPTLRELKYTAPYMHNGAFFTLEEVIDFYVQGGGQDPGKSPLLRPLRRSAQEKKDLLAFLLSLSSDKPIVVPPPALPEYAAIK